MRSRKKKETVRKMTWHKNTACLYRGYKVVLRSRERQQKTPATISGSKKRPLGGAVSREKIKTDSNELTVVLLANLQNIRYVLPLSGSLISFITDTLKVLYSSAQWRH